MTKKKNSMSRNKKNPMLNGKMLFKNLAICLLLGFGFLYMGCSIDEVNGSLAVEEKLIETSKAIIPELVSASMIESFTVNTDVIAPGQDVIISWKIKNAMSFEVIGFDKMEDRVLMMEDSHVAYLEETRDFTLVAYGSAGNIERTSLTVTVNKDLPLVIDFSADRYEINPGDEVVISWNIENAQNIDLQGWEKMPDRIFGLSDQLSAFPLKTTQFSVIAFGKDGSFVEKSIVIKVIDEPIINSFTASKTEISRGQFVFLEWSTSNTESCTLLTSLGVKIPNRPISGKLGITPNQSMTVSLIAIGADGKSITQEISITVN